MKLYELIETAKNTGDMIIRNNDDLSIRYNIVTESFVFCDRTNGQFYKYERDETGFNQVILSYKLFTGDWHLEPVNKIEPIYINGTNFTDYDKAIKYINTLKQRRDVLHLYEKAYRETGIKPIILLDKETIEFINKEFSK